MLFYTTNEIFISIQFFVYTHHLIAVTKERLIQKNDTQIKFSRVGVSDLHASHSMLFTLLICVLNWHFFRRLSQFIRRYSFLSRIIDFCLAQN